MKKLRWAMDGGFWDVDVSTPVTLDGSARPVPREPLPLGLSRGARLSRHKQVDFLQRFMAMPLVPNHDPGRGLSLLRVFTLSLPSFSGDSWFMALLGQFNVQKFVTSVRMNDLWKGLNTSTLQSIWRHLSDKTFYSLDFSSEYSFTHQDSMLLSLETCGDDQVPRKKAVFHHKFPNHNLMVEATSPSLFVDQQGDYWNVPFTMAMDLSSVAVDSGTSCHFCINRNAGSPKQYKSFGSTQDSDKTSGQFTHRIPAALFPGVWIKCAVSFKKNVDIWRSDAQKIKRVQPYDIFLSNPHISGSGILGAVVSASLGDNIRDRVVNESYGFQAKGVNAVVLADLFASVSLSGQHGNFQKPFRDLTRLHAQLDFPSMSNFLVGATRMASNIYNSHLPNMEAVHAVCPSASLSFQQQLAGPFSFRVDAGVTLDSKKKDWTFNIKDPVIAIEYALQVLGSAKAVAWYSLRQREFMIELRFFET